jgi:hypothetical protein
MRIDREADPGLTGFPGRCQSGKGRAWFFAKCRSSISAAPDGATAYEAGGALSMPRTSSESSIDAAQWGA